jgi:hypothetical protein
LGITAFPVFSDCQIIYHCCKILNRTQAPAPDDERMIPMKEKLIAEIMKLLKTKDENQLLYILTFIKRMFGSH